MSNIQIQRDNKGTMNLVVGDQHALGSHVTGITNIDGIGLTAIVWIPINHVTFAEVRNVVPFVRPPT